MYRFVRSVIVFALSALCIFWTAVNAEAERKLALVVGQNDYQEVPKLQKAVGDSKAIAEALAGLGFEVTTAENVDRRGFNTALSKFYASIEPGDTVLFQYSGHGVQIENDNYLLPVDVPAPTDGNPELLKGESIRLLSVVDTLAMKGAGARILIIDACRDNPFASGKASRSIGATRGLANVSASKGSFIMYSAGAGQTALDRLDDNDGEPTSVYTRVLISKLQTPGLKLRDIAASARDEVEVLAKSVSHEQSPAYYDELPSTFTLAPAAVEDGSSEQAVYVPPKAITPEQPKSGLTEDQAYKLAEGINTVDGWKAFLENYPDGAYAPFAKAAREKLVGETAAKEKPAKKQVAAAEPDNERVVPKPKPKMDACKGFGRVTGLDPNGDNFLSVRTGPAPSFTEIDRIYTGNGVKICSSQGRWLKITYSGGKGWVHGRYIAR
jgi:hypothetical protein